MEDDIVVVVLLLLLGTIAILAKQNTRYHVNRKKYHESVIAHDNPSHIKECFRMDFESFQSLLLILVCKGKLSSGRSVSAGEKLHILIHILKGHTVASTAELFQRSKSTIDASLHEVLNCFERLESSFFIAPSVDKIPQEIYSNSKYYPYFKDCIGALDGTHIPAKIEGDSTRWRDRKGNLSQNVLAVCNFDLTVSYCLAGWEGSAHDAKVLADAWRKGLFQKRHKYYLADAGYGLSVSVLTPYRGERYHLKEFSQNHTDRPKNMKELFNLRHSMLRNHIERTFGVIKKRWKLLDTAMESFSYGIQIKLVKVAIMVHNHIRRSVSIDDESFAWSEIEKHAWYWRKTSVQQTKKQIPPLPYDQTVTHSIYHTI